MQYLRTHPRTLGCSKCRWSRGGCGRCRAEAAGGAAETPSPRVVPSTGRKQRAEQQQPHLSGGKGSTAGKRRRERREQPQREAVEAAEEEEVPSQDVLGRRSSPASAATARRKSGVGGGAAGGRVFEGLAFLVTGFVEANEAKAAVLAALQRHGGTVLDKHPDPPQQACRGAALGGTEVRGHGGMACATATAAWRVVALLAGRICVNLCPASLASLARQTPAKARRQSAGARQLGPHAERPVFAVISDKDRLRTPKYLYACASGLPVLGPSWVLESARTGRRVRACWCRDGGVSGAPF